MFGEYRNFRHPAGEITLSNVSISRERNERGYLTSLKKRIQIAGVIALDTSGLTSAQAQDALRTAIRQREEAYSQDGGNFVFYHDDGTPSAHTLDSGGAIGGVRVVDFSWPNGDAAEYATQRTFSVTLEAEYVPPENNNGNGSDGGGGGSLLKFQETIEVVGTGGPRKAVIELLNGPPQIQIVNQRTKVTMTQRGSAVGLLSYPKAPGPIAPEYEDQDRRQIGYTGPTSSNGAFKNWCR